MNKVKNIIAIVWLSKQKAVLGSIVAGLLALLSQIGVDGEMTVRQVLDAIAVSLGTWVTVYFKGNRK